MRRKSWNPGIRIAIILLSTIIKDIPCSAQLNAMVDSVKLYTIYDEDTPLRILKRGREIPVSTFVEKGPVLRIYGRLINDSEDDCVIELTPKEEALTNITPKLIAVEIGYNVKGKTYKGKDRTSQVDAGVLFPTVIEEDDRFITTIPPGETEFDMKFFRFMIATGFLPADYEDLGKYSRRKRVRIAKRIAKYKEEILDTIELVFDFNYTDPIWERNIRGLELIIE